MSGSLRSRVGALVRQVRRSSAPTIDVVVVVEPVDRARLDAALRSVADQDYAAATVRVCPLTDSEPTWQAAANAGVAAGTGDLVVLLRGCDVLAPDVLRRAAEALATSGAAFCSGRVEQAGQPEPWLSRAQREPLRLSLAGDGAATVGLDRDRSRRRLAALDHHRPSARGRRTRRPPRAACRHLAPRPRHPRLRRDPQLATRPGRAP